MQTSLRLKFVRAIRGLYLMWLTEASMRIHFAAAALVFWLGFVVGLSGVEWAILTVAVGIVVVSEGFNSVVEKAMDVVEPDSHPLVCYVKDAAAGTVLLAAIMSVFVGYAVFWPKVADVPELLAARFGSAPSLTAAGLLVWLVFGLGAIMGIIRR